MGHVLARTKAGGLLRWGVEAPWEVLQHELARMPEEDREEVMSVRDLPLHLPCSPPAPARLRASASQPRSLPASSPPPPCLPPSPHHPSGAPTIRR